MRNLLNEQFFKTPVFQHYEKVLKTVQNKVILPQSIDSKCQEIYVIGSHNIRETKIKVKQREEVQKRTINKAWRISKKKKKRGK